MDGLTATKRLREMESREGWHRVPVMAVTASLVEETGDEVRCSAVVVIGADLIVCAQCTRVGMDAFLQKPVLMESLKGKLMEILSDMK